jgi:zinc/manganese transport system substrate-binding protein/manganese/iron transport system substrate-binding protein
MPQHARRRPAPFRPALVVSIAAGAALALAGCAGAPAQSSADGGPSIVATTTQVGDFTRELVGEQADVTQLLEAGQSAHSFDPSAAQLGALADADALVINGAGLESWIDDAVAASGFDGLLIDASEGIEVYGSHSHDEDEPADEHAADDHAEHEHAADDHAEGNPHIWTDPSLASVMVANIAHGLEDVEGLEAADVEEHEAAYQEQLQALDLWIGENVDAVPADQRLLVTNHDAFTYFVDAYGITFVGSVIPSFDDNAEPSAAEIDELVAKIRETGVKAVFSEASISAKTAETIATEAGVTVYSGDDALYGDSLGAEGTAGATYLGSQIHNVRLILESWGVSATELPAALEG